MKVKEAMRRGRKASSSSEDEAMEASPSRHGLVVNGTVPVTRSRPEAIPNSGPEGVAQKKKEVAKSLPPPLEGSEQERAEERLVRFMMDRHK